MTSSADLAAALRAHARGLHCLEAAAELLIGHRTWLHRSDFTGLITVGPATLDGTHLAAVDWPAAITALNDGDMPCSGSEARMLRIAASLAHGIPVDLHQALTGLDGNNADLVTLAVLHAMNRRPRPSAPRHS